ncbi:trichohyalin-like [Pelmatolapia mariae]|uniref:trichohyalin-like n=1 Tax=Pelmatolapia mariae TaxID=158779 RepID=UPI002FE50D30
MEEELLIGWQEEKLHLKQEVCRLQEELAQSHAEKDELESRNRALKDRLWRSLSPSLALSLQLEGEQREWKKKVREGREREARQALLIHRLQNKVLEYRERCQHLELRLQDNHTQMLSTERIIDDSLESALLRLEEEQQRSVSLGDTNSLLCKQLVQSEQANHALKEDLQKLTNDWMTAVEEAEQREADLQKERECRLCLVGEQQARLLSIWRSVAALRRDCHAMKTGADRDLWQLKAEFSRLSSVLLSSCDSVSSSLRLSTLYINPLSFSSASPPLLASHFPPSSFCSPPPSSDLALCPPNSSAPPLLSSSTMRIFSLGELELKEEKDEERRDEEEQGTSEVKSVQETQVLQLKQRIEALTGSLQTEVSLREEREREAERHRVIQRSLQSVSHAVIKLSRVLTSASSQSLNISSEGVLSLDLSCLLSVLSQTESALQWRNEELQGAQRSLQQLGEQRAALHLRLKQLEDDNQQLHTHTQQQQQELGHIMDVLSREKETASFLRLQVEELQRREEELRRDNHRLRKEKDEQEERNRQLQTEMRRRVETEVLENVQLTKRETLTQAEIYSLKGALEREQLDKQRAEEDASDMRDALQKFRECVSHLSLQESALRREVEEGRDALDKLSALNSSLASDKRELNKQLLKLESELSEGQSQLQAQRSQVSSLEREVKTLNMDFSKLRVQREAEEDAVQQLRERETEPGEDERFPSVGERQRAGRQVDELSFQHAAMCEELKEVQDRLGQAMEEVKNRSIQQQEQLRESRRLQEELDSLQKHKEQLEVDLQEIRSVSLSAHQQLSEQQKRLSQSEVEKCQLNTHIHTLKQAKDTLHGEIQCLRGELEEMMSRAEDEKKRREMSEEERKALQEDMERMTEEIEKLRRRRRRREEMERKDETEAEQEERSFFSENSGRRGAEVLRNYIEGLTEEVEERQREEEKMRKEVIEMKTQINLMIERVQRLEGEKEELEEEVKRTEERLREEKKFWEERRREETKQRDREVEALCERMERLKREKKVDQLRTEAERDRWRVRVEEQEEEINRLKKEISTLQEDERRKKDKLLEEKEEVVAKLLEKLKEKAAEAELMRQRLNVANEKFNEFKAEAKCKEQSLELQVREREGVVEEHREHLKEGEEEGERVNARLKQKEVRGDHLEGSRKGMEKDDTISSQVRELQEGQTKSEGARKRVREMEEARDRLQVEIKEWQERAEHSESEARKLNHICVEQEEEVQRLRAILEEKDEERREWEALSRTEKENTRRLQSKLMEVREEKKSLEEKLREAEEEREALRRAGEETKRVGEQLSEVESDMKDQREVLRKTVEEKRRLENTLKEVQETMKGEMDELIILREEKKRLQDKSIEKGKEADGQMRAKEQQARLLDTEEEEASALRKEVQKEMERSNLEMLVLREAVQKEKRRKEEAQDELLKWREEAQYLREVWGEETQEELRTTKMELLVIKKELQKEQNEKEQIKEKLQRTEEEVTALKEEVQEMENNKLTKTKDDFPQKELRGVKQSLEVMVQNPLQSQVDTLSHSTEEMGEDRDGIGLARSQQTDAALMGYKRRPQKEEQSPVATSDTEGLKERLMVLQSLVAELELDQKRLNKKNFHLENQKDKLKRATHTLRETLQQVAEERSRLRQQLSESIQGSLTNTEEQQLRSKVRELQDQVKQLQFALAVGQQQRAEFIQQSSRNSQSMLSLRLDLSDSLATITQHPVPSILESETQRLDRSMREEELRMSFSQL